MLLRRIPEGQALTGTEDELGIKASSAKIALARLKKAGLLGKNYYVTVKTTEGTRTVYFVHSAKPIEE
jgi:Mn-dependent DtxR family transcriptional regulator